MNTGRRQGLDFFIFLGTKKFNFKSAYSSFWRNKQSVQLKYLIIPQSHVGQDYILRNSITLIDM